MIVTFPTNTIALIVVITVTVVIAFWLIWSQGLKQLPFKESVKRSWQWGVAAVLAVWVAARMDLLSSSKFAQIPNYTRASLIVGLSLSILPFLLPQFRQIVRAIPQVWLIGIHTIRIGGFFFLALMDMKLLPPQFALPAGIGDMAVGILAPIVVYAIAQQKPYARNITVAWNLLGLLDLIVALTTGLLYIGPFAAKVAAYGVALYYLNYVLLIPSVVVPLLATMHFYSLYQMISKQDDKLVIPQALKA